VRLILLLNILKPGNHSADTHKVQRVSRQFVAGTVLCGFWGTGIILGLYVLTRYTSTSAEVLPLPNQWPKHTTIVRAFDRPTMLISLHPRCVCSRATVEELARLLAQVPVLPRVEVLLYRPDNAPESWGQTDVVIRARSMPGVTIRPDPRGREAELFRMSVSGQTAMYASDGRLMFTGGITRARGHEGDNAGRDAIVSILSNQQPVVSSTPVFGCSIGNET
jgi:hypothetical protein